jgi:hypothetical protein
MLTGGKVITNRDVIVKAWQENYNDGRKGETD